MAKTVSQGARWQLKPLHLSDLPPFVEVEGSLTVGRDPSNQLRLTQDEVSAHHVRLELEGDQLWVVDLGSTNGTLVNGQAATRERLASGDTIQLGSGGPRLVALDAAGIRQRASGAEGLGATKIVRAPRPIRTGGAPAVATPTRAEAPSGSPLALSKTLLLAVLFFTLVSMVGAAGVVYLERSGAAERARLAGVSSQIQRRLARQLDDADARLDRQAELWDQQRSGLELERDTLLEQITTFEGDGRRSQEDLQELRQQLAATQQHLEMYDPVGLEQKRLAKVARVRQAVVLIEKKIVYRDVNSGKLLHFDRADGEGDALNLEARGEPLTLDASTGSGFCLDAEGWIVTNAHVLDFATQNFPIQFDQNVDLQPERRLDVVFTDSAVRRPAQVIEVVKHKDKDLALLKIEAFEGIPTVPELDLEATTPAPGSEVFLFGFPLGHHALQEGDTVVASTFKGILSRMVHPFLQVDAGVYPGNSGGPLTDSKGRVIGVIFSVQNNLDGTTAANIGYAIPVSGLSDLWPRKP